MLLVLLGQVLEANPALTVLNALELLHDLLLGVAATFDNRPESDKLLQLNHAIVVHINLVEELHGANLGKATLPVLDGLLLVDFVAAVSVKNSEHFLDLVLDLGAQRLRTC